WRIDEDAVERTGDERRTAAVGLHDGDRSGAESEPAGVLLKEPSTVASDVDRHDKPLLRKGGCLASGCRAQVEGSVSGKRGDEGADLLGRFVLDVPVGPLDRRDRAVHRLQRGEAVVRPEV